MSYGADTHLRVPGGRPLRRSHSQGGETGRPSGAAPNQVQTVINLKTAKVLGLDVPPVPSRPRRRGDRVIEEEHVHHRARRCGGVCARLPARGARAAGGDTGGRASARHAGRTVHRPSRSFAPGVGQRRIRRGPQCRTRAAIRRQPARPAASSGGRPCAAAGLRDRRQCRRGGRSARPCATTIPIVFVTGEDPVKVLGARGEFNQPTNLTRCNF